MLSGDKAVLGTVDKALEIQSIQARGCTSLLTAQSSWGAGVVPSPFHPSKTPISEKVPGNPASVHFWVITANFGHSGFTLS